MRKFIDIISGSQLLFEADETPTKTKSDFSLMPDLDTGGKSLAKAKPRATAPAVVPGKRAGANRTRTAARGQTMNHPGAGEALSGMMNAGVADDISDEEAARNAGYADVGHEAPPTNDNLPAIINHEIEVAGHGTLVPEWHQIKHLPGYMLNAIRAGGRAVFREFTDTPIEDIQMICTLQGMNPESDVKGVMAWVTRNGVEEKKAMMTFGGGIEADVRLWKTEDFSFLLVKDFMGIYVYAWVGGRGVHLGNTKTKRISH